MNKMKKYLIAITLMLAMSLVGCGSNTNNEQASTMIDTQEETTKQAELADGVYTAEFHTDSSMFHVNEACDGKGKLTVENGQMTIHISLASTHIVNLYIGLAEDAAKDGAELLQPTTDTVTYSDGTTEEVYGFDVPVPALDEEFDLALLGTKGKWYDHKVSVTNPVEGYEEQGAGTENAGVDGTEVDGNVAFEGTPDEGTYTDEIKFEGGSGRASIQSPVTLTVGADGKMTATVEWSSPNYDYMIVDGEKLFPVNADGNSVFEIPVSAFDTPITVIGDTVAMSKPHEIEYTLTFLSDTLKNAE